MNALELFLTDEDRDRLLRRCNGNDAFHAELYRAHNLKANLTNARMARQAAAAQTLQIAHHEALGQLEMIVPPWLASQARARHGVDCFTDAGFRRDFARDNPECAIRSRSTKTTITHPGWSPEGANQ